jgi:hypothetical protein
MNLNKIKIQNLFPKKQKCFSCLNNFYFEKHLFLMWEIKDLTFNSKPCFRVAVWGSGKLQILICLNSESSLFMSRNFIKNSKE